MNGFLPSDGLSHRCGGGMVQEACFHGIVRRELLREKKGNKLLCLALG